MKLAKLFLISAVLLGFGLTACSGQSEPESGVEPTIQGPALIMFYTDN